MGFSNLILASLSIAATANAAIPMNFQPSTDMELMVAFGNRIVSPGEALGIDVPAKMPSVGLRNRTGHTDTHLVMMVDPDAPTPEDTSASQILHWMQTDMHINDGPTNAAGIPFTFSSDSKPVAAYRRPMPPPTSAPHRYIQYLYGQPDNFSMPEEFSGFNDRNRTNFDVARFAKAAGLDELIAANFVMVSNSTQSLPPNATGSATSMPGMPSMSGMPGMPMPGAANAISMSSVTFLGAAAAALLAVVA